MGQLPSQIGPYLLRGQLGAGGMGAVYEGLHQVIERPVAIKLLKPEFANDREIVARFFNEARVVNRIDHPSLVQISDYGQTADGTVYLVMERLRGETLRQRLSRLDDLHQRLTEEQVLQLAWQIAEALTAVHNKGVIHRDLKPDNIMLVSDPAVLDGERAKILDFGIAKLLEASQDLTVQSRVLGTPLYMSPEQCRGLRDIDGRTDVYALGVILYRALAGRPPFMGDSLEAVIAQQLFAEPAPLGPQAPHASAKLTKTVHRMLTKERSHRPSMQEVVEVLAAASPRPLRAGTEPSAIVASSVTGPGEQSTTLSYSQTLGRWLFAKRWPRVVMSMLLVAVCVGLAVRTHIWSSAPSRSPELTGAPLRSSEQPDLASPFLPTSGSPAPRSATPAVPSPLVPAPKIIEPRPRLTPAAAAPPSAGHAGPLPNALRPAARTARGAGGQAATTPKKPDRGQTNDGNFYDFSK